MLILNILMLEYLLKNVLCFFYFEKFKSIKLLVEFYCFFNYMLRDEYSER